MIRGRGALRRAARLLAVALALACARDRAACAALGAMPSSQQPSLESLAAAALDVVGIVGYEVRDEATGELMPCKLTFVGVDPTHDPAFTRRDIGRELDGGVAVFNRVFSLTGIGCLDVPRGTFDVHVSRGPEWTVHVERAVVVRETPVVLHARLRRVVDTSGWLAADFHVHASGSADSPVPMLHRVTELVSNGVEMVVSTDHNVITDYRPSIAELAAGPLLTSAMGSEITTRDFGHFTAFPLVQDMTKEGAGAVLVSERSAATILADVRSRFPAAVIVVNHPRIGRRMGYFDLMGLDTVKGRFTEPGASFDFDAIEVLNGFEDARRASVDQVMGDWLALIRLGHVATALGNSDSHHLSYNLAGYPRNYVRVPSDDPPRVRASDVASSVRAHRSFFTTAPFVTVECRGKGIGDTVSVEDGSARVTVLVQAAPWVSVSAVTVFVNGVASEQWVVPASTSVIRLRRDLDVPLAGDTFVVVRAEGDEPLWPSVGDLTQFRVLPFALTNPLFIDADGNGRYDAPLKSRWRR